MSVSSVSSYSSENSSSSSSVTTGKFSSSSSSSSSEASFSSRSTIIAPKPTISSFGCPEYNYFWIENKSNTYPSQSYYYNFKSHCVVWHRPVSKHVSLPCYTNRTVAVETNFSEDDEDLIVSDDESELSKRKRLNLKKRNRRLLIEERDDSIQVLSVKSAVKNKKILDTIWKLYRCPGESVQDLKNRLIDSDTNVLKIKSENITNDNHYGIQEFLNIPIKKELICNDNDYYDFGLKNSIKTLEEDSDSDPEHVSYLIQQEYLMNYEDSEQENERKEDAQDITNENDNNLEDDDEEDSSEDEEFYEQDDLKFPNNFTTKIIKNMSEQNNCDGIDSNDEESYSLADFLDIEIIENDKENIFIPPDNFIDIENNLVEKNINWTFNKSCETLEDSLLTRSILNSIYITPEYKQISNQCLNSKNRKLQKKLRQRKKMPEASIETKSKVCTNCENDQPIICDMYGTRTINYNNPPKIKIPKWQSSSRLSDSSLENSDCEFKNKKIKHELSTSNDNIIENNTNNEVKFKIKSQNHALKLINWFPKKQNKKGKRTRKNSDNSWNISNISDCSDLDEIDIEIMRNKKKRSSFSSAEKENNFGMNDNDAIVPFKLKEEARSPLPISYAEEFKIIGSSTPKKPVVDLNIVKVERSSDLEEDSQNIKIVMKSKENDDNGNSSDSSSSSSSYTCSRSSCSCSSCSSSSSNSSNNDDDDNAISKNIENNS